jgi:RND family efflux transporter MFP subunit
MKLMRWVAVAVAILVVIGAIGLAAARKRSGPTGPPTAKVERRDLSNTLTATGIVQAMVGAEVKVGSRISGRVEKLYANVGDKVTAGQVIGLIDDREARAQVGQARAALAAAQSRQQQALSAAAAQPGQSAAGVQQAESAVAAATAHLEQTKAAAAAQPVATGSQIEQAHRALAGSQVRLAQARETAAAAPGSNQAALDQAEAGLQVAQANLKRVQRGARSEEVSQAEATVDQAQARLKEAEANLQRTQTLYAQGYIAAQDLDHSRTNRDVALGDLRAAQQRLTQLKNQTLPEDLDKAKAQLAQAQAALQGARSASVQVSLRQRDVTAAEADVQRAQAALTAAAAGRSQDVIAQREVASTQADLEKARAGLRGARLASVQDELKRRDAETAANQVTQAQAVLRAAEAQLSYARIVAPIDGIIASVATQEGETVSAGLQAPTFVTIIDLHRLEVDAYVDETDIGKVKLGQQVTFTVDAYADRDFSGQVTAIYPKALKQQNVVEYDVVIGIKDPQALLKPDMTANVTIAAETHNHVLAVPTKAIRREGGQKVVYVLQGGKPVTTPVKTGVRDTEYTEIVSGVTEGTVVVVGGPQGPGDKPKVPAPGSPQGR